MRKRVISKVLVLAMMAIVAASPVSQASASVSNQTMGVQQQKAGAKNQVEVPAADVMDVDFSDGTATDKSPLSNSFKTIGNPVIKDSSELHKKIASFDGASAYQYGFNEEKYGKITEQVSIECMFKYNSIPSSGEAEVFSNQQGGGIGLGTVDGKLTFFAHVGGGYKEPTAEIQAGQWVHAVGVVDGTSVKLYVNGELKKEIQASGGVKYPESEGARSFIIGGDSDSAGGAQFLSKSNVSAARLYGKALTAEQVKALNDKAFEGADISEIGASKVNLGIVASDTAAESGQMNVDLHVNTEEVSKVNKVTYNLDYDPDVVSYAGVQHKMSGVDINSDTEGKLKVTVNKSLTIDGFREFGSTRIGKLNFRTKNVKGNKETEFKTSNFKAYVDEQEVTAQAATKDTKKTVTVYDKKQLDLNEDGVIGAGDVALARTSTQKKAIANEAAIYPYKHAVVLTVDGGGQAWNPDEIYYTNSNSKLPKKTSDAEIMAKRKNTYAMDLFNKEFATSYSAKAVYPSISAQNYSSILHGIPWGDAPLEYQVTNSIAGQKYYADFGKEEAKYPSVFKALQKASPERPMAAFAEWTPILNGIIEPDAGVIGKGSASRQSFYDVAKYIKSDAFDNTSMIYMQSDYMDAVGHGTGYYNDRYWSELEQYDDFYKSVVDALKEKGNYDDTLIVSNADHGGSGTSHGSSDPSNMDIFIGIGGQTVDSGKKLTGGDNADISPLVLNALRVSKPSSMTGKVFDQSAFLSQDEMTKKNRDIEKVTFERQGAGAVISLGNKKQETRTADMVIDLDGRKVTGIEVPDGAEVLRNETKDGKQYVTVSYKEQPTQMAKVIFDKEASASVKIHEIMLGTEEGDEIYSDLENKQGKAPETTPTEPSKPVPTSYKIKYVLNGGTNTKANPSVYYNQTVTFKNAKRKGYYFKGWYQDSKFKKPIKTIKKGTAQNYTVYAKWSKVKVSKASISSIVKSGKNLRLKLKKTSGAKGYMIKYSTNKKFKNAKYIYVKSNSALLKKLKKNKKYYVKAKAYAIDSTGSKVFGAYSKTRQKTAK